MEGQREMVENRLIKDSAMVGISKKRGISWKLGDDNG